MVWLWQVSGAAAPGAAARAELGLGDDYYSTSAGQRERMLAGTERLAKTGSRIQQGQQQLFETEVSAFGLCKLASVSYMSQAYTLL